MPCRLLDWLVVWFPLYCICIDALLATRIPLLLNTSSDRLLSYYCVVAMSQIPSTSTSSSSSNFRAIFVAAMKAYEKKTKTDLLTHPLATQLQSCGSSSDIIAVLHDKVNEFERSRSHNERLSSWLKPTINVLYAFSAALGQSVGLVSLNDRLYLVSALHRLTDILTRKYHLCWCRRPLLGEYPPIPCEEILMATFSRPPRMSMRVMMHLRSSSSVSRTSSDALNPTRRSQ